ncbi:MAG: ATP-dependent DNA helicase RecG [Candidatus Paceibacterota bacterium]|jgi:ATP-dependent DNA helicase RecG
MEINTTVEKIFRLNPYQKRALAKLGLLTAGDLLRHFPTRYGDVAVMKNIGDLTQGETAVIFGKISNLKTSKAFYKKIPMAEAKITDESGNIKAIWFNQPYIAKMFSEGALVRVEGKVSEKKSKLYLSNPKIEKVDKVPIGVGESLFGSAGDEHYLYPVYPESRGISSNWLYHSTQKVLKSGILDNLIDPIPSEILQKYNLPGLKTALVWIHAPKTENDALAARKRFAFEEVFFIQLERQKARRDYEQNPSFKIIPNEADLIKFKSRFSFTPTGAQERALSNVLADFSKSRPMLRLLEGDVGSGKTFVAAAAAYAAVVTRPPSTRGLAQGKQDFGNLQVAYMAPTEILARQHFESFTEYFAHLPINIGLITGSGCLKFPSKTNPKEATKISRGQLLKWVANGEIPILIGTHALIQKTVRFKHLALAVIDEQHRFGVIQRQKLIRKGELAPHLLSMTATPIPRTLALTIFGDLDLTLLDEMPPGRKPIITDLVLQNDRENTYEKIRAEIVAGRQAYVICPRIDEPDPNKLLALQAKSVKAEAQRLKKEIFPEFEIGILHGKLKPTEKEEVMADFKNGKLNILVATSVVEVGVNVPNATVIVIEGAERFGLAQLHQFRGRVQRSNYQAYCYVFTESQKGNAVRRLKALEQAANGFELAEQDLKIRGAGELSGARQWGLSDIAMDALKNLKMVEAARAEAQRIITEDPTLKNFPTLAEKIKQAEAIHLE